MKKRDVIIGLCLVIIVITIALVIRQFRLNRNTNIPVPSPRIGLNVEDKFPGLVIPENADRTDLKNISETEGNGEAIRVFENGKFNMTIIADLPDPTVGSLYKASIKSGDNEINIGNLVKGKGGYILDFSSSQDLTNYKEVSVLLDNKTLLYGSF